jgi:hypothetical protein
MSHPPVPKPVKGLPKDPKNRDWYSTLEDAIHAWADKNNYHGPKEVPQISVNVHPHVGGWSVE